MAKLNKDILFLIFEELQENPKSLFSCLLVNKLWCETVIPILWRNPWCYVDISYRNKSSLFIIISHYLIDDIKEFITNQRIQLPSGSNQSLLFDYLSFCRSINVNTISNIISIGSSLAYNQFIIQQKFYYFFMKKCPELKYFDMKSIKHQIFYFPEAVVRLESLYELHCDTFVDSSYFYGLSQFCQYIQRLFIVNTDSKPPNHGIIKLIEIQKNLKHFEWDDHFDDYFTDYDTYEKLILALEKKAESLNYLRISFLYLGNYEYTLLQDILSKFNKLKVLMIDEHLSFNEKQLEKLKIQVYRELEVLKIEWNSLNVISSIIENSGGRLKKILFSPYNIIYEPFNFNEDSLNFIRKIYENCPSIEYLSIAFSPSKEHFAEFEKLLKICKNLKSLLLVIMEEDTYENSLKSGKELLKILIRSAPTNFKEIRFCYKFKYSLEILEEFFEKWRGRHAISLFTTEYIKENYRELTYKYKRDGVIKDFKYLPYVDLITDYITKLCF